MSKSRRNIDYLGDIKESIDSVAEYINGLTFDDFLSDKKTRDAVVHNLEIIGEATKNLSNHLRKKYQHIPWKGLAGVRDRLTHGYFDINYEIVWNIAKNELPKLLMQIKEILATEKIEPII
jgi:uncharacterized protein with HEPN domain